MMLTAALSDSVSDIRPTAWQNADQFPALEPGDLHVWLLRIDEWYNESPNTILSADEQERAAKFRRAEDRSDFVVCRGALRALVGRYIGVEPARVPISYAKDGKPFVDDRTTRLKFNVSHSREYALFAFSLDTDVGVDIERIDAGVIDQGTLEYCLHANELEIYNSLNAHEKAPYFFKCWTRKEAYLKLRGDGFAISPAEIDLASIQASLLGPGKSQVCFTELPTVGDYSAIVATKDRPQNIGSYKLGSSLFM